MKIEIIRNATTPSCAFTDNFRGFDKVEAVRKIFGDKTKKTLAQIRVEFTSTTLYMRVDHKGTLLINPHYLGSGDFTDIYLDVIHELVHVKQAWSGKNSDQAVSYVERPLEIEAYRAAVEEAKVLGWDENRILAYLDSDLINAEELTQLARTLEVNCDEMDDLPLNIK